MVKMVVRMGERWLRALGRDGRAHGCKRATLCALPSLPACVQAHISNLHQCLPTAVLTPCALPTLLSPHSSLLIIPWGTAHILGVEPIEKCLLLALRSALIFSGIGSTVCGGSADLSAYLGGLLLRNMLYEAIVRLKQVSSPHRFA